MLCGLAAAAMEAIAMRANAQPGEDTLMVENVGGEAMLLPSAIPTECALESAPDESEAAHLARISACLLPKQAALALATARMALTEATTDTERELARKAEAAAQGQTTRLLVDQPEEVATRKIIVNGAQFDASRHYALRVDDCVSQIKLTGGSSTSWCCTC
jgi:hypothetical protein